MAISTVNVWCGHVINLPTDRDVAMMTKVARNEKRFICRFWKYRRRGAADDHFQTHEKYISRSLFASTSEVVFSLSFESEKIVLDTDLFQMRECVYIFGADLFGNWRENAMQAATSNILFNLHTENKQT